MISVGFDATPLEVSRPSGVTRYARELLCALVARPSPYRITLMASRPLGSGLPALPVWKPQVRVRTIWMQFVLPYILRRQQPALCHFTNSIAPLNCPSPYALTLHDLSLFLWPRTQPLKSRLLMRTLIRPAARRAAAVIVPSQAVRREAVRILELDEDRVVVVHEGASTIFGPGSRSTAIEAVERRFGLDRPFVLAVGTLEPRKNLTRLVAAMAILRREGRREVLVLAGQPGWKTHGLRRTIEHARTRGDVVITGYVDDADLAMLYRAAILVAFPSLYEGFGLPLVEAMRTGAPIVASDRPVMWEVAGDAATYVDPLDDQAIAEGLRGLLDDADRRDALAARGLARSQRFSWEGAADATIEVYDAILADEPASW